MENYSGKHIKGYDLRERIGAGGHGAVYKAYQTTVGRDVAMKIILPAYASHPDFIRRFETEAQVIARLEHMHITPLYDYWRDPEGAFLVMRFLRGGSLRDLLQNGPMDLEAAALLMEQIASALHIAHRNHIIHRDIKPGNMLIDEDGNAYLGDFGIAKDLSQLNGSGTQADAIVGSLDYLSPEQARSESVTPRTDIYSLGVVLYEMLVGQHPFHSLSPMERFFKHINDPLPPIKTLDASVQENVNNVIQKATAKNPSHRYADALELASAFREAAGLNRTPTTGNLVEMLTVREQEILGHIVNGLSNKEIAQRLVVSLPTVKWYINQTYRKLRVRTRVQAIVRARELNLITSDMGVSASGRTIDTSLLPEPENPYKGLRAFEAADTQDFFGREELVKQLLSKLSGAKGSHTSSLQDDKLAGRFLAVVGPSGSGKSSLVKAGLIPAIWRGEIPHSEKWFVVDMLPGTRPLDELEIALLKIAPHATVGLREQLQRDSHGLIRAAQLILPKDDSELVVVIDQFEEVFTLVEDETIRQQFLAMLVSAAHDARSRVRVVITLRADFYDRPLNYPEFGELLRSRMETVLPLGAKSLERAIVGPAERVGISFEAGLVAQIVSEMNYQASALPLLQYALTELFERRDGRLLTHAAYQEIGGATGALARRADDLYNEMTPDAQALTRQIFLRLVTLGEGTEDTRRRTTRRELLAMATPQQNNSESAQGTELIEDILDTYAEYRLLSLDNDPGTREPTVEVAHEAILREWERLRNWLNEGREDIRHQRQLATLATEWQTAKGEHSFLLHGARLEQFETWAAVTEMSLTPTERDYLQASLTQREKQQAQEQERQAREAALEKRAVRVLRALVVVLAVALLGAFGLVGVAVNQSSAAQIERNNAQRSADEFRSIALTFGAQDALNNYQPDVALALSAEAINFDNPPLQSLTTFNQVSQLNWMHQRFVGGHSSNYVWDATFLHDGEHIITTGWTDNTVNKWHIGSGEIVQSIQLEQVAGAIAIHPKMELIAISSVPNHPDASGIVIWNLETDVRFTLALDLSENFLEPEFSPDGTRLFSTSDGTAYIWDVATWELIDSIRIFEGENEVIQHINLSGDGALLTAACRCSAVKIVDVESGDVLQTRTYPDAHSIWTSDFLLDSAYVLTGRLGDTSHIELWNWQTEEQVWEFELTGHPTIKWARYLEVSPDGKWFALATDANSLPYALQLHETQTGRLLHEYYGHTSRVMHTHFSLDGQFLITTSRDGTAAIWHLLWEGTESFTRLPQSSTASPSVHPTQPLFIYSEEDVIYMGNYETGEILRSRNTERTLHPAFSPDGQYIVAGEWLMTKPIEEQNAYIWNAESGDLLFTLEEHDGWILDIDFSPTEPIVAISQGVNNHILLWQYETGELLQRLEGPHSDHPSAIAYSPDGNYLFSGDQAGVLVQWDVTTGNIVRHFEGHTANITSLDVNSDGTRLLSSGESTYLWDINTGEIVRTLYGNEIFSSQFSPDSTRILTLSRETALQLWDVETGHVLRQYGVQSELEPYGFAYTPDGKNILLTAGNYLIVWDATDNNTTHDTWITENRYIPDFTCEQRALYRIEPLCETQSS